MYVSTPILAYTPSKISYLSTSTMSTHVYEGLDIKDDSSDSHAIDQNGFQQDPEMEGLSLYEKKALLVNRELDSHGMGKYQWYIFFLCGFGYLIDLLYAQAFGLVEPPLQQEFGFGPAQAGNIFSSFSAGLCAGVLSSVDAFTQSPGLTSFSFRPSSGVYWSISLACPSCDSLYSG